MKYNKGFALIKLVTIIVGVLIVGGGVYLLSHVEYFNKDQCSGDIPSIKLIYPVGGESFHVGEKIKVKWNTCNISADKKVTYVINWDKTKDGFGYGTDELNLGINDGEEEIIIPKEVYNSTPQKIVALLDELGSANLSVFVAQSFYFPKHIKCEEGWNCMPPPIIPTDQTKIPIKILSANDDQYDRYIEKGCKIASGCNGPTFCVDEGYEIGVTNCMVLPEFSCYKNNTVKCEKQVSGKCGWTQTTELKSCIEKARNQ